MENATKAYKDIVTYVEGMKKFMDEQEKRLESVPNTDISRNYINGYTTAMKNMLDMLKEKKAAFENA